MNDRSKIADLIPHGGDMVLLQNIIDFSDDHVITSTLSHLDLKNPLRFQGRLTAFAGVEYGAQAMAVYGGLTGGNTAGYLSTLSNITFHVQYLDDVQGALTVEADKTLSNGQVMAYDFRIKNEQGHLLVGGQGLIFLTNETKGQT
ncbi:MAG: hypothetical protein JKY92_05410 [Magnetovibrio sp.]|nr:hypothetical protein [Magnetovibrio sp.]